MVDQERVCCLCGDVGFADKLFQCSRCHFRFQHSYCSNYYGGSMELSSSSSISTCDWCQSEVVVGSRNGSSSSNNYSRIKSSSSSSTMDAHEHQYNNHQIKLPSKSSSSKNNSGVPSPRPNSHRRYKLLKDVMC